MTVYSTFTNKNGARKQIPDFPDYEICKDGGAISNKRKTRKLMVPFVRHDNVYVKLRANNENHAKQIASLVAEAFVDNPDQHKHVKFLDGNSTNIHLENLERSDDPYDSNEKWKIPNKPNRNT